MSSNVKRYRVCVSQQRDDKTYYTRIGTGFHRLDKDVISIKLSAHPMTDEMVLFVDDEERPNRPAQQPTRESPTRRTPAGNMHTSSSRRNDDDAVFYDEECHEYYALTEKGRMYLIKESESPLVLKVPANVVYITGTIGAKE